MRKGLDFHSSELVPNLFRKPANLVRTTVTFPSEQSQPCALSEMYFLLTCANVSNVLYNRGPKPEPKCCVNQALQQKNRKINKPKKTAGSSVSYLGSFARRLVLLQLKLYFH